MKSIGRREFIATGAFAAGTLVTARAAFSRSTGQSRLVVVILRGALDGIAAVPPYGDPDYARLRRELAIGAPGSTDGALKLDGLSGLHPQLTFLHERFGARELVVFHAIASPYRERSHFEGQDVLENGLLRPYATQSGWLNRALAAIPAAKRGVIAENGVALGQNIPLLMRGPADVVSWSPSRLAALEDDTLNRIADLYSTDALLSRRLADALQADKIATGMNTASGKGGVARYEETVQAVAGFLKREDGPQVAVFDTTGWDTHANEGNSKGQLGTRLAALDSGLRTLKAQLGPVWNDTAVLVVTEFGRTAAANGTRGTDHGTGAAAFLVGGAVQGGRVIADWPGLSAGALYQGRDLKPTTDLRSVLKGVLADHLSVPERQLESSVFPESTRARPMRGLIRG